MDKRKELLTKSSPEEDESLNIATVKVFLQKKFQSASSLILKPKTHVCKVKVTTTEDVIELVIADGTFLNEVTSINSFEILLINYPTLYLFTTGSYFSAW